MTEFKVPNLSDIDKKDISYTYLLFASVFSEGKDTKEDREHVIRWMIKLILTVHYHLSRRVPVQYEQRLKLNYFDSVIIFNILDDGRCYITQNWNDMYFVDYSSLKTKFKAIKKLNTSIKRIGFTNHKITMLCSEESREWYKQIVIKYDPRYREKFNSNKEESVQTQ